ncbi:MAG: Stp1/IreP family PP2C-type Ser/Thr phosphatase [Eubacteriales bacterium]|nr:Stp1/IreP family PP2C-type Ser/Thr phosphatase [Eubacteriales bacterium]
MKSVSLTHTGMVRKENQDSVINLRDMKGNYFIGVADGMGGHKAGDVASRTLTEELIRFFRKADKRKCYQDPEYLKGVIRQINKRIYELSRSQADYEGMGTTLTLCMTNGKFGRVCQVGDSRAYIVGEEGIHQITRDQSLVQFMVDNNQITPEEARVHPSRHVILSAVGTEEDVDIDMYAFTIRKGEKILICSDGLSDNFTDEELYGIIRSNPNVKRCVVELIEQANRRGGTDNISAIIFEA